MIEDRTGIGGLIKEGLTRLRRLHVHKLVAKEIVAGTITARVSDIKIGDTVGVDHINEYTSAHGVDADGVLLKDSEVTTDVINEKTGAAGVTIDSVLLKDGVIAIGDVAFDDGTSDPLIDGAAAADGTENSVARKDHVHPKHHAAVTVGDTLHTLSTQEISGVAASVTQVGHVELATGAETNTGTSAALAVTPDGLDDWTGSAQVVTVGALASGSLAAGFTDVPVAQGGTGASTAQAAIDALSAVSGATNEHVLTKDTASGNAIFKVAAAGGGAVATDVIWDAAGDLAIGTGADSAVRLPIGADHTALVSNGTTASWSAAPPLAAIADTGDTTRITIGTATPHLTLTGDERINGRLAINSAHVAGVQIEISPTVTTSDAWIGLETNPVVTLDTAGKNAVGVAGQILAKPQSTAHNVKGLSFIATVQSDAAGVTLTSVYGLYAKASVIAMPAKDMNVALFSMFKVDSVVSPTAYAALTFGSFKVVDLPTTINITDADITMPAISYGIHLGDLAGARFNAVHLLEIGPTTPYLRLLGNANPAANQTNLYLKEEATLRQVQWKDGAAIGAGDKVMVLV